MPLKVLRPLLIVEFLIAIQAVFTFWSQVGGQYHLDLMYWPWKFGLAVTAAWLITAMTANLIQNEGEIRGRFWLLATMFFATLAIAGAVTYYFHVNEPDDESDAGGDEQPSITRLAPPQTPPPYQTRQELARTIG